MKSILVFLLAVVFSGGGAHTGVSPVTTVVTLGDGTQQTDYEALSKKIYDHLFESRI